MLPPPRTACCEISVRRHGPLPLGTPTPGRGMRIQGTVGCLCCPRRLMPASHLSRRMPASCPGAYPPLPLPSVASRKMTDEDNDPSRQGRPIGWADEAQMPKPRHTGRMCRVSDGPGLELDRTLLELMRHASGPWTQPALDPMRAVRPSLSPAPAVQHASEERARKDRKSACDAWPRFDRGTVRPRRAGRGRGAAEGQAELYACVCSASALL